jgi:hypothetical protein
MLDFIKNRVQGGKQVVPHLIEIQFLEVFKKLIECGWIVNLVEFN